MKLFLSLFAMILLFALPVSAQDMLRHHRTKNPSAELLESGKEAKVPTSIADYANLYYDSCTRSSEDENLEKYVTQQCACTAAKMTEFMTLADMQTLFTSTPNGDYQQGRVFLLAYFPCLQDSVKDFVMDSCFTPELRKRAQYSRRVCECYSDVLATYASTKAPLLVPGFTRTAFNSEKSVPDPFAYIVKHKYFTRKGDMQYQKCYSIEEYGWNK